MKIASLGLEIAPGKYKYTDDCFSGLVGKFKPKKTSPFFLEFIGDLQKAEAVVFSPSRKIDLIVNDLDLVEKRLAKTEDEREKKVLEKLQKFLEEEKLISQVNLSGEEKTAIQNLSFVSACPCLEKESVENINDFLGEIILAAGVVLFYTAGPKEVHTWSIREGSTVVEAAGKIHSDLARGFIKADVVKCEELLSVFNMAEAKSKGLVRVVGKEYLIERGDVIEVRFSV